MRKFNDYTLKKKLTLDEQGIIAAIKAAEEAKSKGEKAIGAALFWSKGNVVTDYSTEMTEGDRTCHAVVNVLKKASQLYGRRLDDAVIYTTVEPCLFCMAAIQTSGVQELVFGAYDLKNGFISNKLLADHVELPFVFRGGVMAEECKSLLPISEQEHFSE